MWNIVYVYTLLEKATATHSCLENPLDRGAWWATVHEVSKSQTWLSNWAQARGVTRWVLTTLEEGVDGHRGSLLAVIQVRCWTELGQWQWSWREVARVVWEKWLTLWCMGYGERGRGFQGWLIHSGLSNSLVAVEESWWESYIQFGSWQI